MRINEIHDGLLRFTASVRIRCGTTSMIVKTAVEADSQAQARALLCHVYGAANVLSVTQTISEEGAKVLSPDEQRVKAISDQAKRLQQQAKQMKAQNAVKKAQSRLSALKMST